MSNKRNMFKKYRTNATKCKIHACMIKRKAGILTAGDVIAPLVLSL